MLNRGIAAAVTKQLRRVSEEKGRTESACMCVGGKS